MMTQPNFTNETLINPSASAPAIKPFRKWWLACFVMLACQAEPAKAPATLPAKARPARALATDSEPGIVKLPTGAIEPVVVNEPILATLTAQAILGDWQVSRVELPVGWRAPDTQGGRVTQVSVSGETSAPFSFFVANHSDDSAADPGADVLWLRRTKEHGRSELVVTIYTAAGSGSDPGHIYTVKLKLGALPQLASIQPAQLLQGLAEFASNTRSDFPLYALLAERFTEASTRIRGKLTPVPELTSRTGEWQDLMSLTTGLTSIEGALQRGATLNPGAPEGRPRIPIGRLSGPNLRPHAWAPMLRLSGRPVPQEPLAKATPRSFYYARAKSVGALFQLLDESDSWLTPALRLLEGHSESRDLSRRYQTELGLRPTQLAKLLGPSLIDQLALVGSDPFLTLGSDVTLLVQVKSRTAFALALAKNLSDLETTHGKATIATSEYKGTQVTLSESADHAVHVYRAAFGSVHMLSNSRHALERVLDTLAGRSAALSAELDFQYMLGRDAAVEEDILLYAGDHFLSTIVAPATRILEARRRRAQAELLQVSHAALAHGWVFGRLPASAQELKASRLLRATELNHFDGSPITFDPELGPSSKWGSPKRAASLLDLYPPDKVSANEQRAYEDFARSYESVWADALDPVALRIKLDKTEKVTRISAKLRVLPIISDRDYSEIAALVGDVRLEPAPIANGLRALFAIAKDSSLRRELDGSAREILGRKLSLQWLGDYAFVGVADHAVIANTLAPHLRRRPTNNSELPGETESLFKLPLYAAIAVRSPTLAAVAVALAKDKITALGSGMVRRGPDQQYHAQTIWQFEGPGAERIFGALTQHALYISLSLPTLKSLIDDDAAGKLPRPLKLASPQSGQFFLELMGKEHGGLLTSAIWAFDHYQSEEPDSSRDRAEAVLRAFPVSPDRERIARISVNYLGSVPLTRDGHQFYMTPTGVGDAIRGSEHRPIWPALPVTGSAAERILRGLTSIRSSMSFDPEASPDPTRPERSLAISVEIRRRAAARGNSAP